MNNHKGFSLLEILVAFSILAISLGILLKIFSSGLNTAVIAEEYTIATQIAESLMAKTGVETPLTPGESSGTEDEKYQWKVTVDKFINPEVDEELSVELLSVLVQIKWSENEQYGRTIELNSVKIRQKK